MIIFEPYYENYGPDTILSGAVSRFVKLHPPDWHFDPEELETAFNSKTRAIIINTPNNPTGKVFSRQELKTIADLCLKWDVVAITDEIYEHILYEQLLPYANGNAGGHAGQNHHYKWLEQNLQRYGMACRIYNCFAQLTQGIRKVHDFLTVGAPAPLQEAGVKALGLPKQYYLDLAEAYQRRRDLLLSFLRAARFDCSTPCGAYYIMAGFGALSSLNDTEFTRYLVEKIGVAVVPGSSFFHQAQSGSKYVRFCFSKRDSTLQQAGERLRKLTPKP